MDPQPGDKYIKGNAVVEITFVSDKQVKYVIRSSGDVVSLGRAEFDELARKTLENGGRLERAGDSVMSEEAFS